MEKGVVKKAFNQAKKEVNEENIKRVKELVKSLLKRIVELDSEIKKLQEERKYLKMDIDDLKEGRLDRIEERQKKDEKAKKYAKIKVNRGEIADRDDTSGTWHVPFNVTFYDSTSSTVYTSSQSAADPVVFTNSLVKYATVGTYDIDGTIINLR